MQIKEIVRIPEYYVRILLSAISMKGKGECPCCKEKIRYYKPYGTKKLRTNAECPKCRAAERDRIERIWLEKQNWGGGEDVLHFAPEAGQYEYLSKKFINYWPVDIDSNMKNIKKVEDITNISFEDDTFDLIICNQVLEHVIQDEKSIRELARVLRKNGRCLITVPIDDNNPTLCEEWINTTALRIKFYGEDNHVRMYGNDFDKVLLKNGLKSKKIYAKDLANTESLVKAGLKKDAYFWLCYN